MSVAQIAGVPRATPVVEFGIGQSWITGGAGGVWDVSLWDAATSTWVGTFPSFVDVTCDVIDVSTFVGRERVTDIWEVGTATITVRNHNGWADYPQTVGTTQLQVRPGIAVRIAMAIDGGVPWPMWFGYIDATSPGFDPSEGAVVVCDCIDAKGDAGRVELGQVADPGVGAAEGVSTRIARILNSAGWPAELRSIVADPKPLLATTLGAATVDLLNLAAQSSGGDVFGDVAGQVAYRPADWQTWNFDDPVDAVIGPYTIPDYVTLQEDPVGSDLYLFDPLTYVEDPTGSGLFMLTSTDAQLLEGPKGLFAPAWYSAVVVCPSLWELSNARADYATRVLVARHSDETPLEFEDPVGRGLYGVETFEVTDLETQLTADLTTIGNRLLVTRGVKTSPRIAAVTIDAGTASNTVDVITYADPRTPSRFQCRHVDTIGSVSVERFNRMMLVTSVEHTITPTEWICRIGLDDAAPWMQGADTGRWDVDLWDRCVWGQTWS